MWRQQGRLRTLTLDGLKHNDGRKVNNVGEVIDGHTYFVDIIPAEASETAPVIQKQVVKALSRPRQENGAEPATAMAREQVHSTYCGVSSDNTSAMRIGVKNACTDDCPQLVYNRCASHILELLVGDIAICQVPRDPYHMHGVIVYTAGYSYSTELAAF